MGVITEKIASLQRTLSADLRSSEPLEVPQVLDSLRAHMERTLLQLNHLKQLKKGGELTLMAAEAHLISMRFAHTLKWSCGWYNHIHGELWTVLPDLCLLAFSMRNLAELIERPG